MNREGQIALEYIMILGLILVISTPFFYYGFYQANNDVRLGQAEDSVKTVINAADSVYSSGLGTKTSVKITIPSGVISGGTYENTFVLNLSIFGGVSEFHGQSKANLIISDNLLNKIKNRGQIRVDIETFKDTDGKTKVLLGGFCGDKICSSTESADVCASDCTSFCPDLICDSTEDCSCADCFGQQSVCSSTQVCDQDGSGQCVNGVQIKCGDKICTGLTGDNCNDCESDCPLVSGYQCCPYDPDGIYYVLLQTSSCPSVPPSVTGCNDYCAFIGDYENGFCRQNEAQCTKAGETYQSGGNTYCSGNPTGDFCCCKPD